MAFILTVIVLFSSGIYLYIQQGRGTDGGDGAPDDEAGMAPTYLDISIQDVEGGYFNLSQYKGKVVLLDMFATWCGPCKTQLGELERIFDVYPGTELSIITIDVDRDESAAMVKAFKDDRGLEWRFAVTNPALSRAFPASSIPTLYYLDEQGRVADKAVGAETFSEVKDRVDRIRQD